MMDTAMENQYHPSSASGATSPSNPPFPQDLFPLDFLSFVDSASPNGGLADFSLPSPGQPQNGHPLQLQQQQQQQQSAGTSSYHSSPLFEPSVGRSPLDLPPSRGGSSKGRSRSRAQPAKKASSTAQGQGKRGSHAGAQAQGHGQQGMDVDLDQMMGMDSQMSQEEINMRLASVYGLQGMEGLDAFIDSSGGALGMSQGMLQQFEGIHMQSPIIFDPNNPSQAHNPMAQFLASPPQHDGHRKGSINMMNGLITPGASTEMYPQQTDQMMSPMQLEMLARREQMEGMPELNMVPLLSPALNHNHSSQYSSPVIYPNFNPSPNPTQTPLEALQEQSRQFQTQLNALQAQQRQLQATAAAVAASSAQSSPFITGNGSGNSNGNGNNFPSSGSSGYSRPVTTPGVGGHGGSAEPSPSYFTPLTSPALEATRQYQSFSAGNNANGNGSGQRHPHPLSALSSPALNPLGSSGGAQQTLSPALHAQNNAELSDPDYLRALVGMFENPSGSGSGQPQENGYSGNGNGNQQYQSPSLGPQQGYQYQQNPTYTPNFGPSSAPVQAAGSGSGSSNGTAGPGLGPGPHRHPLPSKSRPSPLVKPVNHRSHIRTPSMHQAFSQPSSPAVLKGIAPGTYLPSAAMDQRNTIAGSTTSTPSPVDLTSIMPPPPVPVHNGKGKGLTPMTPAALMNLGGGASAGTGKRQVLPKVDGAAVAKGGQAGQKGSGKKAIAASTAAVPVVSSGSALGAAGTPAAVAVKKGGRIVTGKRLAARPSGVGVRTATKGAAAAAIAQSQPPETENRRTSHKAAEQKRRDSLKAGFDELRLLLPPINTEALDPESGEPIPGSSAPRLLPKSSLVPDDNPNRGVSKVALLKFSNEYIVKLHEKVDRRDEYIERLRMEVGRLREGEGEGEMVYMEDGVDLLEFDIREGEEEEEEEEGEGGEGGEGEGEDGEEGEEDLEDLDEDEGMDDDEVEMSAVAGKKVGSRRNTINGAAKKAAVGGGGLVKRPSVGRRESSGGTVTPRNRRGD